MVSRNKTLWFWQWELFLPTNSEISRIFHGSLLTSRALLLKAGQVEVSATKCCAKAKDQGEIQEQKKTIVTIKVMFLVDGTLVITACWTAYFNMIVMGCFQWEATH